MCSSIVKALKFTAPHLAIYATFSNGIGTHVVQDILDVLTAQDMLLFERKPMTAIEIPLTRVEFIIQDRRIYDENTVPPMLFNKVHAYVAKLIRSNWTSDHIGGNLDFACKGRVSLANDIHEESENLPSHIILEISPVDEESLTRVRVGLTAVIALAFDELAENYPDNVKVKRNSDLDISLHGTGWKFQVVHPPMFIMLGMLSSNGGYNVGDGGNISVDDNLRNMLKDIYLTYHGLPEEQSEMRQKLLAYRTARAEFALTVQMITLEHRIDGIMNFAFESVRRLANCPDRSTHSLRKPNKPSTIEDAAIVASTAAARVVRLTLSDVATPAIASAAASAGAAITVAQTSATDAIVAAAAAAAAAVATMGTLASSDEEMSFNISAKIAADAAQAVQDAIGYSSPLGGLRRGAVSRDSVQTKKIINTAIAAASAYRSMKLVTDPTYGAASASYDTEYVPRVYFHVSDLTQEIHHKYEHEILLYKL